MDFISRSFRWVLVTIFLTGFSDITNAQNLAVVATKQQPDYFDTPTYEAARQGLMQALSYADLSVAAQSIAYTDNCEQDICWDTHQKQLLQTVADQNNGIATMIVFDLSYRQEKGAAATRGSIIINAKAIDVTTGYLYTLVDQTSPTFIEPAGCDPACRLTLINQNAQFVARDAGAALAQILKDSVVKTAFDIEIRNTTPQMATELEQSLMTIDNYSSGDLSLQSKMAIQQWFDSQSTLHYQLYSSYSGGRIQRHLQKLFEENEHVFDIQYDANVQQFVLSHQATSHTNIYLFAIIFFSVAVIVTGVVLTKTKGNKSFAIASVAIVVVIASTVGAFRSQQIANNKKTQQEMADNLRDSAFWVVTQQNGRLEDYDEYLQSCISCQFEQEASQKINQLQRENQARQEWVIRTVQRRLVELGYDNVPVDGVVDSRTQNAIRAFQQALSYEVTGIVDQLLIRQLNQAYKQRQQEENQVAQATQNRRLDAAEKLTYLGYMNSTPDFSEETFVEAINSFIRARGKAATSMFDDDTYELIIGEYQNQKDTELWRQTKQNGSLQAVQSYLEKFSNGQYTQEAKSLMAEAKQRLAFAEKLAKFKANALPNGILLSLNSQFLAYKDQISQVLFNCGLTVVPDGEFANRVYPKLIVNGTMERAQLDSEHIGKLNQQLRLTDTKGKTIASHTSQQSASSYVSEQGMLNQLFSNYGSDLAGSAICGS